MLYDLESSEDFALTHLAGYNLIKLWVLKVYISLKFTSFPVQQTKYKREVVYARVTL